MSKVWKSQLAPEAVIRPAPLKTAPSFIAPMAACRVAPASLPQWVPGVVGATLLQAAPKSPPRSATRSATRPSAPWP